MIASERLVRQAGMQHGCGKVHAIADHPLPQSEFSRPLDVSAVPPEGLARALRATPEECQSLCRRFDLKGLRALAAEINITLARGAEGESALRFEAVIHAEVTQMCVVTLKAFQTKVVEVFTIFFQLVAGQEEPSPEVNFGSDLIELLKTSEIDAGELVAQQLALALDPHPRAPGVEWRGSGDGSNGENMTLPVGGPFAKLGQLKHKM